MLLAAPTLRRGLRPSPPAGRLASRIDAPDRDRDLSLMSLQFVGTLGQNSIDIGADQRASAFTPAVRATSAPVGRVSPAVDRSDRTQHAGHVLAPKPLQRLPAKPRGDISRANCLTSQ